jgi:TIR domain
MTCICGGVYNIGCMAFKVFLSYSTDKEGQVMVWRLQTLAAAYGIHVHVPQRAGFLLPSSDRARVVPSSTRKAIDEADCVLAIITAPTDRQVELELNYALGRKKLIIPIVEEGIRDLGAFPSIFRFSPDDSPGSVEAQVMEFLTRQKLTKENRQALGALVAVGMGLLLLGAAAER